MIFFRFENNFPGPDFADGFIKRHPGLTVRTANLIKRGRAAVSHDDINSFFSNFRESSAGVPSGNFMNYDETNLRDDPGIPNFVML